MQENALKTVEAAKNSKFDDARTAVAQINLRCADCHSEYR